MWGIPSYIEGGYNLFELILLFLIPIMIIFWISPLVVYIEYKKAAIQKQIWKVLEKLDMKKQMKLNITLLDLE